uniref:Uncharacterized protein n=1 Tax=Ditylenchus dipsaci TaxID=166011 RepID=A0A915D1E7_9BILA
MLYFFIPLSFLFGWTNASPSLPLGSAADSGLTIGSSAASKLLTHYAHAALRQPKQMTLDLRSGSGQPWFDCIAHVDSKNRIALGNMKVSFHNNQMEAKMEDIVVRSDSNIILLPLPFFLGEDIAHITAEIPEAMVRLKVVDNFNVDLDQCNISITDMQIRLEKAYLLNLLLSPFHKILPRSLIHDSACELLAESLAKLRRRFAIELPLASIVPEKFLPYLISPNVSIFSQLESIVAHNEQLTASAIIDWTEMSSLASNSDEEDGSGTRNQDDKSRGNAGAGSSENSGLNAVSERLQLWLEDRLLNELMEHFKWDFEWMEENIPVDSPKLPKSTSAFLSTLCTNCYFLLKYCLQKKRKIFMKVVNPSRNIDAVFINFALTLSIRLTPQIENGIFRTEVDLLETDIRMEDGAFPNGWKGFLQDLVKDMIMDVIWPGLKKEIENLSYSDGVQIPPYCGLLPQSARLHFDQGRLGASAALNLDELSLSQCLQQLKSKLPDPSKLFVIREDTF